LCAKEVSTDKKLNALRTCVPDDTTSELADEAYSQHMVDNYCPVNSIQIIKSISDDKIEEEKATYPVGKYPLKYVPFKGKSS